MLIASMSDVFLLCISKRVGPLCIAAGPVYERDFLREKLGGTLLAERVIQHPSFIPVRILDVVMRIRSFHDNPFTCIGEGLHYQTGGLSLLVIRVCVSALNSAEHLRQIQAAHKPTAGDAIIIPEQSLENTTDLIPCSIDGVKGVFRFTHGNVIFPLGESALDRVKLIAVEDTSLELEAVAWEPMQVSPVENNSILTFSARYSTISLYQ